MNQITKLNQITIFLHHVISPSWHASAPGSLWYLVLVFGVGIWCWYLVLVFGFGVCAGVGGLIGVCCDPLSLRETMHRLATVSQIYWLNSITYHADPRGP